MYFERNDLPRVGKSRVEISEIKNPGLGNFYVDGVTIPYIALDASPELKTYLIVEQIPDQNLTLIDVGYGNISEASMTANNSQLSRAAITNATRYCLGTLDATKKSAGSVSKIAPKLMKLIKDTNRVENDYVYKYTRNAQISISENMFSTDLSTRKEYDYGDIICFYQTGAAVYKNEEFGEPKTHVFHRFNYLAKDKTTSGKLLGDCFYVFESKGRDLNSYLSQNSKNLKKFVDVMLTPEYLRDTRGESLIPSVGGYDIEKEQRNNGFAAWEIDDINKMIGRDFSGKKIRSSEPMGR